MQLDRLDIAMIVLGPGNRVGFDRWFYSGRLPLQLF
jgi:hypothetical protein